LSIPISSCGPETLKRKRLPAEKRLKWGKIGDGREKSG
jgi:hypothetical protein